MSSTRSKTIQLRANVNSNSTLFEYPYPVSETGPGVSKITFTKHDFKLLQPAKFLNDTIIYFFMQYHLDHQVDSETKSRLHVFNSFFFAKIKSIYQKRVAVPPSYDFASRWFKTVDIFKKDFLIIPVCDRDHWLLVIVCYPANLPSRNSRNIIDQNLFEPAVIVLNSCKGLAPAIRKALGQFLEQQWRQERGNDRKFVIHNTKNNGIRFLFPELPQQKNNYDCGVYILGYFYSFLKNPRNAYIKMFRGHGLKNWFVDNQLDITRERRRMLSLARKQHEQWRDTYAGKIDQNKNINSGIDEINIISSQDEDSSVDCIETTPMIIELKNSPPENQLINQTKTRNGTGPKKSNERTTSIATRRNGIDVQVIN